MRPILSCSIPEVDAALGNELVVGGKRAIPVGGHRRESGRPATWLGRASAASRPSGPLQTDVGQGDGNRLNAEKAEGRRVAGAADFDAASRDIVSFAQSLFECNCAPQSPSYSR
ncbi:MAG: hypothetical protein ACJ8AW_00400 [Rhodopila sp.]